MSITVLKKIVLYQNYPKEHYPFGRSKKKVLWVWLMSVLPETENQASSGGHTNTSKGILTNFLGKKKKKQQPLYLL